MARLKSGPVDVSQESSSLKYPAKQNTSLPRLPPNITVHKRPINHVPVASPFAGAKVQKVVYVSRQTPVISAVKRVKKFLNEIEKRALQSKGVNGVLERAGNRRRENNDAGEELQRQLGEVSEHLARETEEVLVKASGRAIEQALRVAEWFRNREDEVRTTVEVRTGSVSVVDDLVEREEQGEEDGRVVIREHGQEREGGEGGEQGKEAETSMFDGGDTPMELLENLTSQRREGGKERRQDSDAADQGHGASTESRDGGEAAGPTKRRRKRKRKEYDPNDVPEARIRWVKTIEVAISLKA